MSKKKQSRRDKIPTAPLKKEYNTKIRQEYIDIDYTDKLDNTKKVHKLPDGTMVSELEWMSIFMKEWNNGNVSKQSQAKKNKFHRTAKEVKECTDRTNMRNRDQYGVAKALKMIDRLDYEALLRKKEYLDKKKSLNPAFVEDAMIDYLDYVKELGESTDDGDDKS